MSLLNTQQPSHLYIYIYIHHIQRHNGARGLGHGRLLFEGTRECRIRLHDRMSHQL